MYRLCIKKNRQSSATCISHVPSALGRCTRGPAVRIWLLPHNDSRTWLVPLIKLSCAAVTTGWRHLQSYDVRIRASWIDWLVDLLILTLLTPWSTVLEKLAGFQLVGKFPTFYGNRRFITVFTRAGHLSLSWASSIQSIPPHPTSWRSLSERALYRLLTFQYQISCPSFVS